MINAISPISDEIEEIFKPLAAITHTTMATSAGIGIMISSTPKPVATPLPPSKNKNTEKQCPTTANTANVQSTPSGAPSSIATTMTKTPLMASKNSVMAPSFFAS